jgi:hypothetical protein
LCEEADEACREDAGGDATCVVVGTDEGDPCTLGYDSCAGDLECREKDAGGDAACVVVGENKDDPCTPGYDSCENGLKCKEGATAGEGTCATPLDMNAAAPADALSAIDDSITFSVAVSGFENSADANSVQLDILDIAVPGLAFTVGNGSTAGDTITFTVTVKYDGTTAFPAGSASVPFELKDMPDGYALDDSSGSVTINIRDGQAKTPNRVILVDEAIIEDFNDYANTTSGLTRHYKLIEDAVLLPPVAPSQSNWTAIGDLNSPFTGSFDGDGHTITGLTIDVSGILPVSHPSTSNQGMFGVIGANAVVENLGLKEVGIIGRNNIGGLAGQNNGTVQRCYVTGSVRGISPGGVYVGGLVGTNGINGMVQDSYAECDVSGTSAVGGLVGSNGIVNGDSSVTGSNSTVQNSYATGNVSGNNINSGTIIGGLVGMNILNSTVKNSYATGVVSGNSSIGGLVGWNILDSTVQGNMALNPKVSGLSAAGRVVGSDDNSGTLSGNRAFAGMTGMAWSNPGHDRPNGAGIDGGTMGIGNFPDQFKAPPWTYELSKLPGLGQAIDMPAHLLP